MKITVGIFFGGKSTEHEVSVITGLQAFSAIDKNKYNAVPIYITKENDFYIGDGIGKIEEYSDLTTLLKKSRQVALLNQSGGIQGRVGLYEITPRKIDMKKPVAVLDAGLPAVHGTNVEDGALQGFFEMLGLPYAGCDVLSSAVGMDKTVMKAVLKQAGIPVLDCVTFTSKKFVENKGGIIAEINEKIGSPAIVKPNNLGSSIGITIAENQEQLTAAIEHALLFSDRVLVERAITNLKEVNCSVLGDRDFAEASECEEPVSSGGILDFNDKYSSGSSGGKTGNSNGKGMASLKRKIPAEITDDQREEIRGMAVKAFKALGCSGVARIDFLIDVGFSPLPVASPLDEGGNTTLQTQRGKTVYFNEINTIPGSLSFYLWEPVGVDYPTLLDRMISHALKREREKSNLNYSFKSNIMSNFKGGLGSKNKV